MSVLRHLGLGASFMLATIFASPVQADSYPKQPVEMIVNFPPGGLTDVIGRALANEMQQHLGQPVVVVNKEGAGGIIGVSAIANAKKTGYEIGFIASAALVSLPHMRSVKYGLDSFDYVCQAFDVPFFVLVAPDSPYQSLVEMLNAARTAPHKVKYGTVGPGTLPHLTAVDMLLSVEANAGHVPFPGEGPAVTALLGKHIDFYVGTSAVQKTHNLRPLAVAAEQRVPGYPEIPTLKESGHNVVWSVSGGIIAPKGMPQEARSALERACKQAGGSSAYQEKLKSLNVGNVYADGQAFRQHLDAEYEKNGKLIASIGLLKK